MDIWSALIHFSKTNLLRGDNIPMIRFLQKRSRLKKGMAEMRIESAKKNSISEVILNVNFIVEYNDEASSPSVVMIDMNNRLKKCNLLVNHLAMTKTNLENELADHNFHYEISKLEINKQLLTESLKKSKFIL
jgi:hypothetical protein